MKKCKFCGKQIIQSKGGSWRLYGLLAGLLAGSQYSCNAYSQDHFYDLDGPYHEPDNSETSKVTDILLNYE